MAATVQSAIQFWRNFELPRLQKTLDVTAKELANRQDESDQSRKNLLDLSRDFKKNTPEDIRKTVVPLLKSFQAEVDSLSRRSKAAEAAFLAVYRPLIEMPDPVPALELCHSLCQRWMRNRDLEMENRRLREILALSSNHQHYNGKGKDVTIKLLRKKVRSFEDISESTIEEPSEANGEELSTSRSVEEEKELFEVEQKLEETLKQVAQLQSALESTQSELDDFKNKDDGDSQIKSEEIEIIVNDLDRANQRAALAETEVRHLKEQLVAAKQSLQLADQIQKAPDMEQAVDVVARSSLELELNAKEKEISQLVDDIQRLQSTLNTLKETSASKIAQLQDIVHEKEKMILDLGDKLGKQKDYEDIKKELSVLKSVDMIASRPWERENEEKRNERTHNESTPTDSEVMRLTKTESNYHSNPCSFGQELFARHLVTKGEHKSPASSPPTEERKPTPTLDGSGAADASPEPSPTAAAKEPIFTPSDTTSLEKLQEALRHNIDKYANETLNTLNISRCVRELLSVHNIGQRLFAKFVLGLSQGTVSELLSKPKPWDKLTEKGRDSYRKMHAWASDDKCIFMLKSLVPRRGKESGSCGSQSFKQDDQGAEERIVQILNEAQMAMMKQQERKSPTASLPNGSLLAANNASDSRSLDSCDDNRVENGDQKISSSIFKESSSSNLSSRRSRKYENDDIPQEMVARIYQEELAKLVGQRVEEGFRNPRDQYERTQEEIRQALTIYHQELTRLSHLMPHNHPNSFNPFAANGNSFAGSLAQHHNSNSSSSSTVVPTTNGNSHHPRYLPPQECPVDATIGTRTRTESKRSSRDESEVRHHGSAFSLVRPKTEPNTTSSSSVPASLNKTSSSGSYHLHSNSSPAPPPLLPLSEAAAAVPPGSGSSSEDLSTSASPLQRMQSITNSLLSQSAVPSIPNTPQRPAKAVLPPITQHQFDQYNNLNTEDIVKKVKEQLSQYSISQRLFGESVLGLSQGSVSDLLARPKPWHMLTQKGREPFIRMKIFLEDDNAVHKLVASQYKIAPEKLMRTGGFGGATINPPTVLPPFGSSKLNPRPQESNHRTSESRQSTQNNGIYSSSQNHSSRSSCLTPDTLPISLTAYNSNSSTNSISGNNHGSSSKKASITRGYNQPSVYEMAALTTDLDTQIITSKIKETLMAHNIGQKIFGEVVLGLSQGSVSELLSKPKPWHMLSIKGREPFIRMQMWLNDPHNVEMLQTIKNERREANKRRRAGDGPMDSPKSHSESHMYGYNFAPPSPYPPAKKPRVLFTEEQKEALKLAFSLDPYPSTATIEFLATELNLSVRTITNWFHNHRMRMKQHGATSDDEQRKSSNSSPGAVVPAREGLGFDPIHYRVLLSQRLADKFREKGGGAPFFGGSVPFLYSPYRNCSPLSSSGDDVGTLDLSMSSHLKNSNLVKSDNAGSSTDDRSNSEMNDDSNLSQGPIITELSDRDSPDDIRDSRLDERPHRTASPPLSTLRQQQQSRVAGGGSSNRRKPAMPQWVDPGLELSPDSDVHTDDEDDGDESGGEQIINGVCVRQTQNFDLMLPREETVHVLPVAAPDANENHQKGSHKSLKPTGHRSSSHAVASSKDTVSDNEPVEDGDLVNGRTYAKDSSDEFYSKTAIKKDDPKTVFSDEEDDDSWDDDAAEATDRRKNIEKLQQRLEKEDAGEAWEF